jgi:hypothetical protein
MKYDKYRIFFEIGAMGRQSFTNIDAFRTTIQQLDGGWLLNGGRDWRWHRTSVKVRDCEIQIGGVARAGRLGDGVTRNLSMRFRWWGAVPIIETA